ETLVLPRMLAVVLVDLALHLLHALPQIFRWRLHGSLTRLQYLSWIENRPCLWLRLRLGLRQRFDCDAHLNGSIARLICLVGSGDQQLRFADRAGQPFDDRRAGPGAVLFPRRLHGVGAILAELGVVFLVARSVGMSDDFDARPAAPEHTGVKRDAERKLVDCRNVRREQLSLVERELVEHLGKSAASGCSSAFGLFGLGRFLRSVARLLVIGLSLDTDRGAAERLGVDIAAVGRLGGGTIRERLGSGARSASPLLHHVRELVREQFASRAADGIVAAGCERNLVAFGESLRPQTPGL